jgi:hypothetical protein
LVQVVAAVVAEIAVVVVVVVVVAIEKASVPAILLTIAMPTFSRLGAREVAKVNFYAPKILS